MPSDSENESDKVAATRPTKLTDAQLLTRVRKRFCLMEEADRDNRDKAIEDWNFLHVPGSQWDSEVKAARGTRPCYEFNKSRIKSKRISNEMRANRPAGKVRAVENGDKATALTMEGLGRNILQISDFDTIADYAGEYQVGAGMGAWRIVTEYGEDSFDQDILVKAIPYPFNLFWDPASADPMHRDAEDWCLIDGMANTAFEEKYGDIKATNFETGEKFADEADWRTGEITRVCEYHWKEPYKKRLVLLLDGRVLDATDPAVTLLPTEQIKDTRLATCHKILMCIVSADKILTPPRELKGRYHRFIVTHGEWKMVEGKPFWCGGTRYAKDPQRAYNVASTAITETIASAPNSQYWVSTEEAKGNTDQWNKAIAENMPFLVFNPDTKLGNARPQKTGGAEVPIALIQEAQIRDQELKDVWGVYDASLGDKGNESSGRAISRRNEQGQIVNFNFPDNMAKAKQLTVTVINDLIPFYYDSARTVRVLGHDGAEEYVQINTAGIDPKTGERKLLNDLTKGKYDVTVTVGPSFATQRQEAAEAYAAMAPQDPLLMPTAADLVYQSLDLPYADQIAERRRAMLPPQIQALLKQGKDVPPEVKRAQTLIESAKVELAEQGKLVQAASEEAKTEKAEADKAKAAAEVAKANLEAARAALATDVANFKALVANDKAAIAAGQASNEQSAAANGEATDKEQLAARMETGLALIERALAAQVDKHAANLSELHRSAVESAQPQVIVANAPKGRRVAISKRQPNGEIHTEITDAPAEPAMGVH